ncbi:hypothetical protein KEM55_007428 [Ascosphaera atra]|nr:hypothetical protein KEM55_007428 [Ascosphaera atra]
MQEGELDESAKQRREEILRARRGEQVVFEGQAMKLRHANMRAMARFLKTRSEPVLYYKPWKLRADQERDIEEQISEVEAIIAQEREEFEERRKARKEEGQLAAQQPQQSLSEVGANGQQKPQHEAASKEQSTEATTSEGQPQATGPSQKTEDVEMEDANNSTAQEQENKAPSGDEQTEGSKSMEESESTKGPAVTENATSGAQGPTQDTAQAAQEQTQAQRETNELKAHEDEVMEEDREDTVIY